MTRAAILLAALGLSACAANIAPQASVSEPREPDVSTTPVTLTKAQIAVLEAGIRKSLKDPDSARFGSHKAGRNKEGDITVCGYVNARNSYGGYTGEKPYIAGITKDGRAAIVIGMGGTDIETMSVTQVCRNSGLFT